MEVRRREGYDGTGPGAITPDGCAVELYSRIPVDDSPHLIARSVPSGATILELGCGVGRMTHPLLEHGFTVTAVDESPEMLERVRGARTVLSPIETLDLGEHFDVVLLASFLVHAGSEDVRRGLLRTCLRHVADGGCVLIQREGRSWHDEAPWERALRDEAGNAGTFRVVSSEPVGPGVNSVHAEYVFPDAVWTQTFLSRPLSTEQFEQALAEVGLRVDAYLTDDGMWVRAVPAAAAP